MVHNERFLSGFAGLDQRVQAIRNPESFELDITTRVSIAVNSAAERLRGQGDSTVEVIAVENRDGYVGRVLSWEIDHSGEDRTGRIALKQLGVTVTTDDEGRERTGFSYAGTHTALSTDNVQDFEQLSGIRGFSQLSPEDQVNVLVDTSVTVIRETSHVPEMVRGERKDENGLLIERIF